MKTLISIIAILFAVHSSAQSNKQVFVNNYMDDKNIYTYLLTLHEGKNNGYITDTIAIDTIAIEFINDALKNDDMSGPPQKLSSTMGKITLKFPCYYKSIDPDDRAWSMYFSKTEYILVNESTVDGEDVSSITHVKGDDMSGWLDEYPVGFITRDEFLKAHDRVSKKISFHIYNKTSKK